MPTGTEVGLGPGDLLDGDPAPPRLSRFAFITSAKEDM